MMPAVKNQIILSAIYLFCINTRYVLIIVLLFLTLTDTWCGIVHTAIKTTGRIRDDTLNMGTNRGSSAC